MITLSNFTLKIDIPALTRIADSLEGIHQQLNSIRLTNQEIESRLLEIGHELEDLNESSKPSEPTKPNVPYYY